MLTFTYVGPLEAVEVDEASGVRPGDTVEVTAERAPTFRAAPESWREVKSKPKKPRPGATDTPTENTEES
jgi:protein involved in polysaccharide export with SLBB domain